MEFNQFLIAYSDHMIRRVEAIYTAPSEALPVVRHDRTHARSGIGLDGDRYANGTGYWSGDNKVSRDLTLIEAEAIERVCRELETGAFRRNIVTRGVKLNELVGRRFAVGKVVGSGCVLTGAPINASEAARN